MDTLETRRSAARDNLTRSVEFRAEQSDDGLTLEGYGAVFNDWTELSDQTGPFMEQIAPGAFARSIGRQIPKLQYDHGKHPLIGSLTIGRIVKIEEDDHGLKVRARLSDNWLIEPVRDAIRDGGITGMSFRFSIPEGGETWEQRDGVDYRTITSVHLLEVGPVCWPAYEASSVSVRSRQTAAALTDPAIRSEVARILTLSPDELRDIADESPAPAPALTSPGPVGAVDALADPGPAKTQRTPAQRRGIAAAALSSERP